MIERRRRILDVLHRDGRVNVNELSRMLQCSAVTIRSDIRALEGDRKLVRTHGGAVLIDEDRLSYMDGLSGREKDRFPHYPGKSLYDMVAEKTRIAKCAYDLIENEDSLFLDDASATFYLALEIRDHREKNVSVVTNSLLVASELANLAHVEVGIVGGIVGGRQPSTLGERAASRIADLTVDKAFMGVHGVNLDVGLTSLAQPQKMVKQAILKTTDEVYVLADSSRFSYQSKNVICPFYMVKGIISDSGVPEQERNLAKKRGVNLITV